MRVSKSTQAGDILAHLGALPMEALNQKSVERGHSVAFDETVRIQGVATAIFAAARAKGSFSASEVSDALRECGLSDITARRVITALKNKAANDAQKRIGTYTWKISADIVRADD